MKSLIRLPASESTPETLVSPGVVKGVERTGNYTIVTTGFKRYNVWDPNRVIWDQLEEVRRSKKK